MPESLELETPPQSHSLSTKDGNAPGNLLEVIMRAATDPRLDVDKLERLLAMQERLEANQRKERFFAALTACQKEMPRVGKNGFIDPKGANIPYAKLEDLDSCIRPVYERHGFSVYYDAPTTESGKIRTTARFSCGGHTEATEITAAPDAGDAGRLKTSPVQAVKKTITASRRHLLEMFFNIITVDADTDGMHGSVAVITQEQADDLRSKLQEIESDKGRYNVMMAKFLRIYKIDTVEEMKALDLKDAYARIESVRKSK